MLNLNNTLDGYLKNVEVIGNTVQDENNLADIRSVGDKVDGQELYNISIQVDNGNGVNEVVEILSPVQLEKVGDVADRIICKDGVWGVEKNVDAEVQNNVLVNTKTNSEFIPLPHDQQVKLRTFAGQTNIAFLTEIAGQIKAQVPKSLGATVNTHTEQIKDLHNSLDRVKKLEESTVSTVETESNFTTVDATSNGYFEDMKLEGKTLVNLCDIKSTSTTTVKQLNLKNLNTLKENTDYTIIYTYNTASSMGGRIRFSYVNDIGNPTYIGTTCYGNGVKVEKINFPTINNLQVAIQTFESNVEFKADNIILLEGDHTNNPPEYFEGLMSVGQDVEEVSVESVNDNLFDEECINAELHSNGVASSIIDEKYIHTSFVDISNIGDNFSILLWDVVNNVKTDYVVNYRFYDAEYNFISTSYSSNAKYVKFRVYANGNLIPVNDFNFMLNKGENPHPYQPAEQDKKPLLYYNPTSETWEKPILREWDTIEKHSDGKYYYHKRSGEVVLNGSENNWTKYSEDVNTTRFAIDIFAKSASQGLCNTVTYIVGDSSDTEHCRVDGSGKFVVWISRGKIATQDVTGFKAWLQANPTTVVYQLAQEEVYECTNIDLMTYSGETNYIVNSGVISPKSIIKVHNNISNVVKILQEKVSLLENTFIAGLKSVLAGDMYSLATILYPEDFEQNDNIENDIMVIPE